MSTAQSSANDDTSTGYTLLQLSSAEGPVYRRVKNSTTVRDARPDEIPTIDISGIFSDSVNERQAVADQIHDASINTGFFYIKNHGVTELIIKRAYESSLEFFRQSKEIKEAVNATLTPSLNGWKGPSTQRINANESVDIRETFSFRYNPNYDPSISLPLNEIPEEVRQYLYTDDFCWERTSNLPHFQEHIIEYWRATMNLASNLVHSFALSLSLPETHFDTKITYPDAGIGLNYYPSMPSPVSSDSEEQVSIGSHTDFQLFTILWQDSNGGLQVLNREGEWINAAPIEGTFVVNIGDYLQRITNDMYISTVHRAKNLSGRDRISMPLFFGFNLNETCGVLENCVSMGEEPNYKPISCHEWVMLRVREMHKTYSLISELS